jgi:hypothetical protein
VWMWPLTLSHHLPLWRERKRDFGQ